MRALKNRIYLYFSQNQANGTIVCAMLIRSGKKRGTIYALHSPDRFLDLFRNALLTDGMKQFLFIAEKANLIGKVGGAFGSHTHSGESAPMIYETMQHVFKMDMADLGPLNLTEALMKTDEGRQACQQYGKGLCQKFGG